MNRVNRILFEGLRLARDAEAPHVGDYELAALPGWRDEMLDRVTLWMLREGCALLLADSELRLSLN